MANWKEVGEVPDSDDELDFDSQESDALPHLDLPPKSPERASPTTKAPEESIWDVPESSQARSTSKVATAQDAASSREEVIPSAGEPPSSPLSSIMDVDELAEMVGWQIQEIASAPTMKHMYTSDGRNESPDPLMEDDSISKSYVKITAAPPEFPFENEIQSLSPPAASMASQPSRRTPSSSESPPRSPPRSPQMRQETTPARGGERRRPKSQPIQRHAIPSQEEEENVARQAVLCYERSLRPRKPIQQHPYLIENAQYSKVFKSHGLRPIRMPNGPTERRQRPDDDSQEKDFEASQGSTADAPNETTDESQPTGLGESANDDLLRLSLSPSPLRTSSPKHRGGPSSQPSQGRETDNTSLSGNDDLPSIDEIYRDSTRPGKRRRLVKTPLAASKPVTALAPDTRPPSPPAFQTYDDIYAIATSPLSSQARGITPDVGTKPMALLGTSGSVAAENEVQHFDDILILSPEQHASFPLARRGVGMPMRDDPHMEGDNGFGLGDLDAMSVQESDGGLGNGSGHGSDGGSEIVKNVGRRIRGVLPASWLRIDQQTSRPKPTQQHHHELSPEKTQKRGVAVRRIGRSTPTAAAPFIFDYSDEELTPAPRPTRNAHNDDIRPALQRSRTQVIEIDDDESSAMEDNQVDYMAPSRKRQLSLKESLQKPAKKQKTTSISGGQAKKPGRPKRAPSRPSRGAHLDPWVKKTRPNKSRPVVKAKTPPLLSILDVVEPHAPQFLKIAARTAQTRRHLGRSSPSKKTIRLATRQDNIDARSVLQKWKGGTIRPRQDLQRRNDLFRPTGRLPLTQLSSNTLSRTPVNLSKHQTGTQPPRSRGEDTGSAADSPGPRRVARSFSKHHSRTSELAQESTNRPAQLETEATEQSGRSGFHAKKRALDALFQRGYSQSLSSGSMRLDSVMDDASSVVSEQSLAAKGPPQLPITEKPRLRRPRKSTRPVQVDVAAARFRHADDPLPTTEAFTLVETPRAALDDGQLHGLGSFGTQYTQHFEVFPLDRGVFFHESTLIGSGLLEAAAIQFPGKVWQYRPRISFHLGQQVLRWDVWSEQVSSELGILMDGVLDQILHTPSAEPDFNTSDATRFVLDYVQKSMSLNDDASAHSFVTRVCDVVRAFLTRLDDAQLDPSKHLRLLDILTNLLLVLFSAIRLCQQHAVLTPEIFTAESIIRKLSESLVGILLEIGLDDVEHLYESLQSLRYRERGIRSDKAVPHAWVLLIKVLETLRIPRMSFWDVAYSRMVQSQVVRGSDALAFEGLWKHMFTLLPLFEFDNMGVLVAGRRHQEPTDGWALPQQLLKRVFQLYRDNPRQTPSFNDYCRTLLSRCHYLIDQWGWLKCGGVVGTLFDFFGSQNLANLRNEEAFSSARFLDHLHQDPPLAVEREDRCFHIFLKLVALTIKKLRQKGLVNDIRNLVARTLPNHDRQYSKEQNVYQHDLAALRNHHDLLCTLFWAAPPDLRPAIHNLEKLVIPASSHKEACLINLRAWNQLARFIVHEESASAFLPLANWQANVFKQLLDQYNFAAADIQQQFLAMSKDVSNNISEDQMNSVVASNKAANMEIMLFSVKSSMDVVQHAGSLELARLASSTIQLQEVFQHFSTLPADFPPVILQASLTTLQRLLGRIEAVFEDADDSQDSMASKTVESEDAILMLERDLAAVFFSMARCVMSNQTARGNTIVRSVSNVCAEQCVVVAGVMTSLFVRCEMMRLSHVFKRGKYGLFENLPNKLSWAQRPYLPLFLATVAQKGAMIDLSDIGIDMLQLWLLIIVQPSHCLKFENQFGQQLQREGYPFVPEKAVGLVVNPGYFSNREFFQHAAKWMRQTLQSADAVSKKEQQAQLSKALNNAMQQIRVDLQLMAAESSDHPNYVRFVRDIISSIITYAADICQVHTFFKEVSKEYAPPVQDPQLQEAKIHSYGLKLAEGDRGVASTLFHIFLNNFKRNLQLGKLPSQVLLLKRTMGDDAIMAFTVRMLSAVVNSTLSCHETYALLDMLCDALGLVWNGPAIARQLGDVVLVSVIALLTSILTWGAAVKGAPLCAEQIHVLRKMIWLINTLQPTIEAFSLAAGNVSWWDDLMERLEWFSLMVEGAREYLKNELSKADTPRLSPLGMFRRLRDTGVDFRVADPTVLTWSANIVDDVQRNWVVTGPVMTVPVTNRDLSSTQSAHGSLKPNWDMGELVMSLHDQCENWYQWWITLKKEPGERDWFEHEGFMMF